MTVFCPLSGCATVWNEPAYLGWQGCMSESGLGSVISAILVNKERATDSTAFIICRIHQFWCVYSLIPLLNSPLICMVQFILSNKQFEMYHIDTTHRTKVQRGTARQSAQCHLLYSSLRTLMEVGIKEFLRFLPELVGRRRQTTYRELLKGIVWTGCGKTSRVPWEQW